MTMVRGNGLTRQQKWWPEEGVQEVKRTWNGMRIGMLEFMWYLLIYWDSDDHSNVESISQIPIKGLPRAPSLFLFLRSSFLFYPSFRTDVRPGTVKKTESSALGIC